MAADLYGLMKSDDRYIEVAVALPVYNTFTYIAPETIATFIVVGKRVLVPFGRRRVTGYVLGESEPLDKKEIKSVLDVLDERPLFPPNMVPFFRWIADYYKYPVGEVVKNALPGGLNVNDHLSVAITEKGRIALKTGQLFGTLRVATTGKTVAPPLFQTMEVLGKDKCLKRIQSALNVLKSAQ